MASLLNEFKSAVDNLGNAGLFTNSSAIPQAIPLATSLMQSQPQASLSNFAQGNNSLAQMASSSVAAPPLPSYPAAGATAAKKTSKVVMIAIGTAVVSLLAAIGIFAAKKLGGGGSESKSKKQKSKSGKRNKNGSDDDDDDDEIAAIADRTQLPYPSARPQPQYPQPQQQQMQQQQRFQPGSATFIPTVQPLAPPADLRYTDQSLRGAPLNPNTRGAEPMLQPGAGSMAYPGMGGGGAAPQGNGGALQFPLPQISGGNGGGGILPLPPPQTTATGSPLPVAMPMQQQPPMQQQVQQSLPPPQQPQQPQPGGDPNFTRL